MERRERGVSYVVDTLENVNSTGPEDGLVKCSENRYVAEGTRVVPKTINTSTNGIPKQINMEPK